jgi:hypothetical protein
MRNIPLQRWLFWLIYAVAGLIGLKYGFDVGVQMSGVLMGAVMGLNAAVFCALVAASVIGWLFRRRTDDQGSERNQDGQDQA